MKKWFLALLACILFFAVGCTGRIFPQRLRIKNNGTVPIENLVVLMPNSEIRFGNLAAGATTEYVNVPNGVYSYAAYRYEWNGQTLTQPVMDWVGEEPIQGREFTYTLAFDPTREQSLKIELVNVTRDQ